MVKILAVIFIMAFSALQAHSSLKEMKYFININKDFKGVLHFNNEIKSTQVNYFNITSRDKIPFYFPSKKFSFTTLNKKPTLKSLLVGNHNKHMIYNLTNLSEEAIEEADINEDDLDSSAIIYNADNLPSEVLEKRLIHTIESLILYISETKKIPTKPFYLYEPHKKMLIKVVFTKEGNKIIDIGSKTCATKSYVLEIAGRNKRLIRIYTNGFPLKIESYTKKWSFIISGVGSTKKVYISNKEIAFRVFKDELLKKYKNYNIKILSQSVKDDVFKKVYVTKFHVSKILTEKRLKSSLLKYTQNNKRIDFVLKQKNAFQYSVKHSDVLELFEDDNEVVDSKQYWGKSIHKKIATNILLKYDRNGDKNYKNLLTKYLKNKYKFFKISEYKEIKSRFNETNLIKYKLSTLNKISNNILYPYAIKALQNKYPENKFVGVLKFVKYKKEWKLFISKKTVQNYACKNIIPSVNSEFNNGYCQSEGKTIHSAKNVKKILNTFIANNYKDLKVLNTKIEYTQDGVRFNYLDGLTKVENGCQ